MVPLAGQSLRPSMLVGLEQKGKYNRARSSAILKGRALRGSECKQSERRGYTSNVTGSQKYEP